MPLDASKIQPLTGNRNDAIKKTIDGFKTATPAHADYLNNVLQQLVDNDTTLEGDTLQAIKDLRRNMVDLALEMELLRGGTLNGMTSNMFVDNFASVAGVTLTSGVHDAAINAVVIR